MFFVISDVHSYYAPMISALEEKGFFENKENKLILLGDALDRGPDAKKVIEFLLMLHREGRLIYIKGNHEALFVDCLQSISRGEIFAIACGMSVHYINGTFGTLLQIADMTTADAMNFPDELVKRVMQSEFYKVLLPSCIDFYETEKYVFTHGYIPMKTEGRRPYFKFKYDVNWRNADENSWYDARWFNGMDLACKYRITEKGKTIVVGHSSVAYGHATFEKRGSETGKNADFSPFAADGILAIDAHTVTSGIVNCVVFDRLE